MPFEISALRIGATPSTLRPIRSAMSPERCGPRPRSAMARKDSALKIIRDKTAFHYDRINITEAAANLAAGENSIYLAQHPANSLYYMGSALVFRAALAMTADKAVRGRSMVVTGSACIRV